jgi:DNA integrity scanning protein DisA with diadenylate cyclase activity
MTVLKRHIYDELIKNLLKARSDFYNLCRSIRLEENAGNYIFAHKLDDQAYSLMNEVFQDIITIDAYRFRSEISKMSSKEMKELLKKFKDINEEDLKKISVSMYLES